MLGIQTQESSKKCVDSENIDNDDDEQEVYKKSSSASTQFEIRLYNVHWIIILYFTYNF